LVPESQNNTAFEKSAADLAQQVREAAVDHGAFGRRLKGCELARCRATCCHDGAIVGEEEVEVIRGVVEERRTQLENYGWREPEEGGFARDDQGKWRTVTRLADPGELADDFPAHFPRTRCVFLDAEHRCVLQRLAMDEGRQSWFWKPFSCWMHPLVLRPGERPVLTLPGAEDRFVSCTHCGREEMEGESAAEVLGEELKMLGAISGRDVAGEVGA